MSFATSWCISSILNCSVIKSRAFCSNQKDSLSWAMKAWSSPKKMPKSDCHHHRLPLVHHHPVVPDLTGAAAGKRLCSGSIQIGMGCKFLRQLQLVFQEGIHLPRDPGRRRERYISCRATRYGPNHQHWNI